MRIISKHIISFDGDYFGFLQDELKSLSKNIRKKFKEKIVKNYFVFGLVDVFAEKKCVWAVTIQCLLSFISLLKR